LAGDLFLSMISKRGETCLIFLPIPEHIRHSTWDTRRACEWNYLHISYFVRIISESLSGTYFKGAVPQLSECPNITLDPSLSKPESWPLCFPLRFAEKTTNNTCLPLPAITICKWVTDGNLFDPHGNSIPLSLFYQRRNESK
jgi:hypothetical protein